MSESELVFYTNPMSRGRIVRWMLEEVGVPYRTELMQYDGLRDPAFLAVNPMGKVPAIRHDGTTVTETAAICAYLADAFPQTGLAPPIDRRGAYYRWLFFAAGPIEAAITANALGWQVPQGRERMAGFGSLALTLDTLDQALTGREYIAGDSFTAADVYVGAQIAFGLMFKSIEPRPSFQEYSHRLGQRPAAIRARAIDDALLPPSPAG